MLDGSNILIGVDADLVWVESTQQELVRRFAEVAHILLEAGHIVVSTTNAIGLADFAAVQALIPDFPVLAVDINTSGKVLWVTPLIFSLTGKESGCQMCSVPKITDSLLLKHHITEAS